MPDRDNLRPQGLIVFISLAATMATAGLIALAAVVVIQGRRIGDLESRLAAERDRAALFEHRYDSILREYAETSDSLMLTLKPGPRDWMLKAEQDAVRRRRAEQP